MSPELLGVLGVGVALGGLQLTLWGVMRADLAAIRADLRDLANRVGTLELRQARLEGLIEGAGLFPATEGRRDETVPA
ncbi:MAG: hypothetical protein OXC19_05815 [Bryobacterales bacterium]|nr:hypothetical protein [Bryobacterales bacterium]